MGSSLDEHSVGVKQPFQQRVEILSPDVYMDVHAIIKNLIF